MSIYANNNATTFSNINVYNLDENSAAGGPGPAENQPFPEINFLPSGNTPEIDLGAPPYDKILAE